MYETVIKPARETGKPAPNRTGIPDRMKARFDAGSRRSSANKWDSIARSLPGRSANAVKNRWLSHLKYRKAAAPDLL